ncbi:MAG: hypothetical protein IJ298_03935 [Ruminococcus sp.]|nr:hypothetical protein [Ruminococcus sp.]
MELILTIIASVVEVITLVALIYQSINLQATINNQIYQSFLNNSLEIDRILIEYPQFRKYVYGNEPIDENTKDIERIMSVMELMIDVSENIEIYKKYIPKSRRKGWMCFVEDVKKSSAYSYYMERYSRWYEVTGRKS